MGKIQFIQFLFLDSDHDVFYTRYIKTEDQDSILKERLLRNKLMELMWHLEIYT